MASISVSRRGPGRPSCRPGHVIADKTYSSTKTRTYLRSHGIKAMPPERIDAQLLEVVALGQAIAYVPESLARRNQRPDVGYRPSRAALSDSGM